MALINSYTFYPPARFARRSLPILLLEELLRNGSSLFGLVELNRVKNNEVDGFRMPLAI